MRKYFIGIEMEGGELQKIMDRLDKAQKEICDCYNALEGLGVLKICAEEDGETAAGESGGHAS